MFSVTRPGYMLQLGTAAATWSMGAAVTSVRTDSPVAAAAAALTVPALSPESSRSGSRSRLMPRKESISATSRGG